MNFFAQQELARRQTLLLAALFLPAVALTILAVYFAVIFALYVTAAYISEDPSYAVLVWWRPGIFYYVACGVLVIVLIGTLYKTFQLRQGGRAVAELLGGTLIQPATADEDERKLLNIVEEMALASGTAVPPVYLLDEENGINAFAAGFSTRDAVIGVTGGSLRNLTRDELQGVIAHEFSHILNGDMRINIRIMGVLHGILVLALLGETMVRAIGRRRGGSSRSKSGGGIIFVLVLGAALWIIGWIGVFFANMIKAAVSRQRELLADASGVQFTRQTDGLAGALKKIGGLSSMLSHPKAGQASHFYFAAGVLESLFSTHPPLVERIRRLDPKFDGKFPDMNSNVPVFKTGTKRGFPLPAGMAQAVSTQAVLDQVGNPAPEHVEYAAGLLERIPPVLNSGVRDPLGARAIIFALFLDAKNPGVKEAQLTHLYSRDNFQVYQRIKKIQEAVAGLDLSLRLPLVELALPALGTMSKQQYAMFRRSAEELIRADGKVEDFELALKLMLFHHLDAHFGIPKKTSETQLKYADECAISLAAFLAHAGHEDKVKAQAAFRTAVEILGNKDAVFTGKPAADTVEHSLEALVLANFNFRRKLIEVCAAAVQHDGKILPQEAELLRAFADALDCPLPPLISSAA